MLQFASHQYRNDKGAHSEEAEKEQCLASASISAHCTENSRISSRISLYQEKRTPRNKGVGGSTPSHFLVPFNYRRVKSRKPEPG